MAIIDGGSERPLTQPAASWPRRGARASLRDDFGWDGLTSSVSAVLDDDRPCDTPAPNVLLGVVTPGPDGKLPDAGPGDQAPEGMWTFTLRQRRRTGYTEDGTPKLQWVDFLRAPALLFEERDEFDAQSGQTLVQAQLKLPYRGPEVVRETIVAVRSDGVTYRVVSVDQLPDRLELDMRRIDQALVDAPVARNENVPPDVRLGEGPPDVVAPGEMYVDTQTWDVYE